MHHEAARSSIAPIRAQRIEPGARHPGMAASAATTSRPPPVAGKFTRLAFVAGAEAAKGGQPDRLIGARGWEAEGWHRGEAGTVEGSPDLAPCPKLQKTFAPKLQKIAPEWPPRRAMDMPVDAAATGIATPARR
jgi:hypothetical protein